MDGKIIRLSEPVTAYERTFHEITLREPTGALFMRLGQPRVPVTNFNAGSGYLVEREDTIVEYLKALIAVDDKDADHLPLAEGLLRKLSLTDSMRLREALFSFFDAAALKAAALRNAEKPQDSSPSA